MQTFSKKPVHPEVGVAAILSKLFHLRNIPLAHTLLPGSMVYKIVMVNPAIYFMSGIVLLWIIILTLDCRDQSLRCNVQSAFSCRSLYTTIWVRGFDFRGDRVCFYLTWFYICLISVFFGLTFHVMRYGYHVNTTCEGYMFNGAICASFISCRSACGSSCS